MGLAKLHMYDLHVPVVSEYKLSVSYEEACEIVKKRLLRWERNTFRISARQWRTGG